MLILYADLVCSLCVLDLICLRDTIKHQTFALPPLPPSQLPPLTERGWQQQKAADCSSEHWQLQTAVVNTGSCSLESSRSQTKGEGEGGGLSQDEGEVRVRVMR